MWKLHQSLLLAFLSRCGCGQRVLNQRRQDLQNTDEYLVRLLLSLNPASVSARHPSPQSHERSAHTSRRSWLHTLGSSVGGLALIGLPEIASASGGATAGKYTSIPIAKRRYTGRIKLGVYDFVMMGRAIDRGELVSPEVAAFFSDTVFENKKKSSFRANYPNAGKTFSRYDDISTAMKLMGNAFRIDATQTPMQVKGYVLAIAFLDDCEKLRKDIMSDNVEKAQKSYAKALESLEPFLDEVELPPTSMLDEYVGGSMRAELACQGAYCI